VTADEELVLPLADCDNIIGLGECEKFNRCLF